VNESGVGASVKWREQGRESALLSSRRLLQTKDFLDNEFFVKEILDSVGGIHKGPPVHGA
jgi:hypothetical protein